MKTLVLKKDIVDAIKKDQILYGQIASMTDHTILSMRVVLDRNISPRLTQISVLNHLAKYFNKDINDLLEEVTIEETDNKCMQYK